LIRVLEYLTASFCFHSSPSDDCYKVSCSSRLLGLAAFRPLAPHPPSCTGAPRVTVPPRHTSMVTVSRRCFGSLARFTFSVRVCHTRTYKITFLSVQLSTKMIGKLFSECGNPYLCAVVRLWLQFLHRCYLFQKIRFLHSWLRTTTLEYGFRMRQNHLKTHSKSLERGGRGRGLRRTFRLCFLCKLH